MSDPNDTAQKQRNRLLAATSAAVILLLALGAFALLPHPVNSASAPAHAPSPVYSAAAPRTAPSADTPRLLDNGAPFSFADLVERVAPAVVTVTVQEKVQEVNTQFDPDSLPEPFRQFFREFGNRDEFKSEPRKAVSMGSGFIIDKSGYIVTNNHVVEDATKISVKLKDGREFTAKLIGTDKPTDIALLKIDGGGALPTVEFGDDRQARVGDWVIAVGNPFGLSNTVTAGIISSIGRDVGNGPYTDYIQIDAPINRGNSGGPTFNIQGKVIGMNSMIYSPSGGSVGIGFAIPASTIQDVVAQLQAHGHVSRGWLGVEIQTVTPEIASSEGMKDAKGAIVATIVPGSPAAKAGFQQGDIVVAVNGKSVEDSRDLSRRVAAIPAGATAAFTVIHDGNHETLKATIGPRKEQEVAAAQSAPAENTGATVQAMGLGLAAINNDLRQTYNLDQGVNGVVVTKVDPDSEAADKGIEAGDVIVSVGNKAVHTPADITKQMAAAKAAGRETVLVLVSTDNGERFIALKTAKT